MRSSIVVLSALTWGASARAAVCPDVELETSDLGLEVAVGDTRNMAADWLPTCGSPVPTGRDYAVEFTAPHDGTFTFDTGGSRFDTTLSLFSTGDCATSLACDDDGGDSVFSRIEWTLSAGETVVVVVDGFNGAEGAFELNIVEVPPPVCVEDADLGTALGQALSTGTTCGAGNDFDHASCGNGQASEDLGFRWQAPATDLFTVDTNGSDYDTAITVRDVGCDELYCDDDGGIGSRSQITFDAVAGEVYYFVVDGYSRARCGDYVLSVAQGCPDADDDSVCDIDDFCAGDDASGDSDGDGRCDDSDLCFGNDLSGDSDGDGQCDDTDFYQDDPRPSDDDFMTWAVHNAAPGAEVFFAVSVQGPGSGPCFGNGVCLDILVESEAKTQTADSSGNASVLIRVPAGTEGRTAWFQSVWSDGVGGDKTEVDSAVVLP